jgi:hypothetical protein
MKTTHFTSHLFAFLLLLGTAVSATADVIDPFTATQGPFTVGPGEELSEQDAILDSASVLGGRRAALPMVEETSEPGSTATLEIADGLFDCLVEFPSLGNFSNMGGCGGAYSRNIGPVFDLTGSSRFLFDIRSVEGGMELGILLFDAFGEVSMGSIANVERGQASIRFDQLMPLTSADGANLSNIEGFAFAIANQMGQEGRVVLTEFSTDGPITGGPEIPVAEEIFAEDLPGAYFDPDRDGEGCQLTLERDQVTFILTCYFYSDGEQFWLIGVGELVTGQITFSEMIITSGAQYGNAFDPEDVVREIWGSAIMTWSDCNNADLELLPIVPGYEEVMLDFTRLVPTTCGNGGVQGDSAEWMGAFFDPNRDGEGFHFGVEANGVFVMTWYTYLDGLQVWIIGTGTRRDMRVVFENMVITSGTDFGSQFDPEDVLRERFGEIIADFTDCNRFTATVNSELPEFHNLVLDVTKIIPGACIP